LGSLQHLKNRHGSGYTVQVQLSIPPPELCQQLLNKLAAAGVAATDTCTTIETSKICASELAEDVDGEGRMQLEEKLQPGCEGAGGGVLTVQMLVDWWLNAQNARAVDSFLADAFAGSLKSTEQHGYYASYEIGGVGHNAVCSGTATIANPLHNSQGTSDPVVAEGANDKPCFCGYTDGEPLNAAAKKQRTEEEAQEQQEVGKQQEGEVRGALTVSIDEYDAADIFERLELARVLK
jgi:hypothetical protein